ncbi:MAG: EAL domain-containing protein, partial [Spirochaetaceae bacterium]|nr:EAL domain-containing protein [Spirochaetaceae bacterium]
AVIALIRDLSFDHALVQQLKESKEHYAALSETITEAMLRMDDGFTIIFANTGVQSTFGWDRAELIGKPFSALFPPEVFSKHEEEFRKYFYVDDQDRQSLGLKRTIEFLGETKHRGVTPMEMSFGNSKFCLGRTLTCIIRDISQRKTLERKLRHLAYHDKLTGLGNRDLFLLEMAQVFKSLEGSPESRSILLFLDLDGFKHVNDSLGHDAGDRLLVETAKRLRVCLRERDSAYRFGSDEFVAVLSGIRDVRDGVIVAERILSSVAEPYLIPSKSKADGNRVTVGVSIGVAVVPDHGHTVEEATKSADIAMYCSKEEGKNRYTIFDPAASAKSSERWALEQELKSAIGDGGFRLHYQPIVGQDGRIVGMEALSRWERLDGRPVPPDVFIPIAEANGLIVSIGDWVLRRACYDARRLEEKTKAGIYVSVNVSSRQFEQPNFAADLEAIVRGSGLRPALLKLELTESALMENTDECAERINDIKRRLPGISFMIDDFGTGYSSLAYLSRLPIETLKVDKSFVLKLDERQNEKVVNAVINLGHSLEMAIVAEGIETKGQWDYFALRKCDMLQGYYFYKPLPLGKVYQAIVGQVPAP